MNNFQYGLIHSLCKQYVFVYTQKAISENALKFILFFFYFQNHESK